MAKEEHLQPTPSIQYLSYAGSPLLYGWLVRITDNFVQQDNFGIKGAAYVRPVGISI
jgi:hypothetical protein